MPKIADVAGGGPYRIPFLMAAVGRPMEWDHIVPYFGRRQVTKGAVYSYYEFVSEQLMDDARVARVASIPATSRLDLSLSVREFTRMSSEKSLLTVLAPSRRLAFRLSAPATGPIRRRRFANRSALVIYRRHSSLARSGEQLIHDPQAFSRALGPILSGAGPGDRQPGRGRRARRTPARNPCSKRHAFPSGKSLFLLLRLAGFKAIGMENNHSTDLGQAARQATRRLLEQNDLTALTYEQSPQFIRLARPDRRHRQPLHDTGPGRTGGGRPMRGPSAEASFGKKHIKPRGRLYSLGK